MAIEGVGPPLIAIALPRTNRLLEFEFGFRSVRKPLSLSLRTRYKRLFRVRQGFDES
jgi:hypothetical protein